MKNRLVSSLCGVAVMGAVAAAPGTVHAELFTGKTISVYAGAGPGTTYSRYARLIAVHMARHLPGNPKMILQNMPGAGGTKAAIHLAKVAPQDGSALLVPHSNLPLSKVLYPDRLKFDISKFHWLGTITPVSSVVALWHEAPATTLEGAKKTELFVGTTGKGAETYQVPVIMNKLLGTKFKPIAGYKGIGGMDKAIEKGELHGRGGSLLSWTARKPGWIKDGKIRFIVQIGLTKSPELPDSLPLLMDLAKNDADREVLQLLSSAGAVGRSLVAPPGVDAARAAALKAAFVATMSDKAFLADTKKQNLAVAPLSSAEIQAIVEKTVNTPDALAKRIRSAIGL